MKIIEALKKIKHIDRKIAKNNSRIKEWASYLQRPDEQDEPLYNVEDLRAMIQSNHDLSIEKSNIRHRLHKTNIAVTAVFCKKVHTIDELLLTQSIVLPDALTTLKQMSRASRTYGDEKAKIVTQYDPKAKDKDIECLENQAAELNDLLDKISLETEVLD